MSTHPNFDKDQNKLVSLCYSGSGKWGPMIIGPTCGQDMKICNVKSCSVPDCGKIKTGDVNGGHSHWSDCTISLALPLGGPRAVAYFTA